ncbi:Plus-3 domain-containing protein [Hirschfeldia incana]|nr:Plus-3 domain-containing protein [Hirschfeldia incana]KAJ0241137.1 Plus-3 domain-containing protein [Hirschfeldia incana]
MAKEEEEKEAEDWCFICKDGGNLMLCDYKDCPKAYHASCVENDIPGGESDDSYICEWHSCYLCGREPKLHCLCCQHAVCEGCVTHAEFIHLKGNKGLCNQCQEYVVVLEEIQRYDAAGDKLDLTDTNTFECLFLECWEIAKQKEGITFEDVLRAKRSQRKVTKLKHKDDRRSSLNDAHTSKPQNQVAKLKHIGDRKHSLSDHKDVRRSSLNDAYTSKSQKQVVKLKHTVDDDEEDYKTVGKKKKTEFIRWGSKPLIDFLTSLGEDTKCAMSQQSVESVIQKYIRQENLLDQKKKKKVRCDEKLYSIFGKRSVKQRKIHRLLDAHFREEIENLECNTRGFSGKNERVSLPCKKKQRIERSHEITYEKEVKPQILPAKKRENEVKLEMRSIKTCCVKEVKPEMLLPTETCVKEVKPEMRPTGFATISADNIKLVYLRKSLVQELLKRKESFGEKVVGSFVKVKNDPRDRIAYQVLQVTGTKTADDHSQALLLDVAGMASSVSISKLDDSDISKEEIENLKQKVTSGLLRQPTVVEMEKKAKALHEDITKHWIGRHLNILQKRINCANEKGRREELDEYLEQRERLQNPSEQERLLRETPRIIEELIEIKREPAAASSESSKQGNMSGMSQEAAIEID